MTADPVLSIRDVSVELATGSKVVNGVTLEVARGGTLGVVGESGAGKTLTLLGALRLVPPTMASVSGQAILDGVDLLRLDPSELRAIRGRDIGVVFQDPLTSLHPSFRVGDQISEAIRLHHPGVSRRDAARRAVALLELVQVPAARRRADDWPHQWSGGMRQRAMIAMAIANDPKVLVADEPTTALDVTIQAQVLEVLREVQRELGLAIVIVTHDVGVVAELADTVAVMQRGHVVEAGAASEVFASPRLPYTAGLLVRRTAVPNTPNPAEGGPVILEVRDLVKHFPSGRGRSGTVTPAVDGVSLELRRGESLGLVGESGCGKSTLARMVVRLLEPTSGTVAFRGRDVTRASGGELRRLHAEVRMVFQDAHSALNPRRTVGDAVAEPLRIHGRFRSGVGVRVQELFALVGLDPALLLRYPHELSGGERQRVGIARALALDPEVLVLDEPVSSLDAPIQSEVLHLLSRLQLNLGLTYLFVSHDLGVVRRLCHRVAVMYLGRLVEIGDVATVYDDPHHPYTRALLSAAPIVSPEERATKRRIVLAGELPDPASPPAGCRFHTRCWLAFGRCAVEEPLLLPPNGPGRRSACHLGREPVPEKGVLPDEDAKWTSDAGRRREHVPL